MYFTYTVIVYRFIYCLYITLAIQASFPILSLLITQRELIIEKKHETVGFKFKVWPV